MAAALGAAMLAGAAASPGAGLAQDALLRDVRIVDVEAGHVGPPGPVLIRDGRIAAIGGPQDGAAAGVGTVIDGAGGYLIPGLWDAHVHVFSAPDEPDWTLPLYLLHGVTGIRDMGALWPIGEQRALQRRIEAGETFGPRLVLSGAWVDASPGSWPGMFLADTPEEAGAVVERIADEGWAAVKSYSMLDEATYLALARAAEAHGLPLVGHIPEPVALGTAIDAGQDGMEHFGRVTKACATREAEMVGEIREALLHGADLGAVMARMAGHNRIVLDSWDAALCEEVLARMAEAGLHISPTLVVADFYTGNWPDPDAPRMRMLPAEVRAGWDRPDFRLEAMTEELRALADASIALDRRTFVMAHEAGVPILASTDASFANPYLFHGASLLDELDLYVAAGLSPREALLTATVAPARFLAGEAAAIAPGARADLVLLYADPLEDLATLRRPRAVIAGGRVLDRAALDALEAGLLRAGR
jgi:hypothetical protein